MRKPGSYWDMIGYPRDTLAARWCLIWILPLIALGFYVVLGGPFWR